VIIVGACSDSASESVLVETPVSTIEPPAASPTVSAAPTSVPPSSTSTPPTTAPPSTTVAPSSGGADPACVRVTDFDTPTWVIVNDGVMGGRSDAEGAVADGVLTWAGTIVTAGGGFSSIRGLVDGQLVDATELVVRIRTDGRPYELLATDALDGRGRVTHYTPIDAVGGDWAEVTVSLVDMEARVFGNPVTAEPFAPDAATQIGIILADGLDGPFAFEIDWIDACP